MDRDNKFQNLFADDDNIMTIDKFVNSLTVMLKKYEVEKELPENCLYVRENFSPKEKKLTSWSVCIHEPYYPAPYGDDKYDKQIEVIVTFRKKDLVKDGLCCTFSVKKSVLEKIHIVGSPKILSGSSSESIMLRYSVNDPGLLLFMDHLFEYRIDNYHSFEAIFGCCFRYVECSDAMKCLHPNKLYSKACAYRRNLESGRVFYGKNKNSSPENE